MNAEIKEIIDYIYIECSEEWGRQLENYILDLEQSLVQSAKNTSKAMELAEACKSRCENAIATLQRNIHFCDKMGYAHDVQDDVLEKLIGGEDDESITKEHD